MEYIAKSNKMNCAMPEIRVCNGWQIINKGKFLFLLLWRDYWEEINMRICFIEFHELRFYFFSLKIL
jgi:hypothetical protein